MSAAEEGAGYVRSVERNLLQELKVGLFVFGLLLLILFGIYILGGSSKMFADEYKLDTSFTDVKGLKTGAVARLAGIDVGQVSRVEFGKDLNKKEIEVEITVRSEFAPRIRADSVASISQIGVLGDMYITLSVGTPEQAELKDGDRIQSTESVDIMSYASKATAIVENAASISKKVDLMMGSEDEASKAHVGDTLSHIETLLADAKNGDGTLHMLLYDKGAATQIKGILSNVQGVTADVKSMTASLRTGDSLAHALLYGTGGEKLTSQIGGAAEAVGGLMTDLKTQDSLAHALLYDPENATMVDDLQKSMANLQGVTDAVNSGEGTLGLLVRDPELYEDVRALMGGAQRNALLRAYVRATVARNRAENGSAWVAPTDSPAKNGQ